MTVVEIAIAVQGAEALDVYASIPIAYAFTEVLDPDIASSPGSLLPFGSRTLNEPRAKDYDREPGNHPLDWPKRFDLRDWAFVTARSGDHLVGGAVVVAGSPNIEMLEGRDDLALLWDIRVVPEARGHGVGTALLASGAAWARARGARQLKVETQNTNVQACRFYASHGFRLKSVRRGAYPELPDEVELLWYKDLEESPLGRASGGN
ncbi:MAG TPA: GNAT family N-acetyltransferase [Gemmatimonadaceae bacterium]|jgi:ribosomal protein S18 acetylase RimI-like enzyme|nr:GNAT family N-acetyltransferase [Gemmatimonadaceae bacterium]